ncbi:hypothetical protein [Photobacterium kishitanii]|uniref:Uncharacterized protein n=1 Tax=Photobacterium kishitanii TaxID=318456 RepID=A0A2T3KLD5_9GAMM|nr:hypothetical protein [Photobacterium kishitanii]PSV00486.1 hypothetical protein C9J27_04960 [Photobacterium kishitanii]
MFQTTTSKYILPVTVLIRDKDEFLLKCPHCGRIRGIPHETGSLHDVVGESYEDNLCSGSFEISYDAQLVTDIAMVEMQPCTFDSDDGKWKNDDEK